MTLAPTSWPGSGSGVGPSCVLLRETAVDIHLAAAYPLLWDALVDDVYNQNTLSGLPSGLGLTASFNGSSATLTTTAAGVWAFTLGVTSPDHADANIRGHTGAVFGNDAAMFGPVDASGDITTLTTIYALPSGASSTVVVVTTVAAAANPYRINASMCVSRLA